MSRYQKGKTNLDFTEARDSEWQWHQLGHMQVCTLLQTENYTSTPPLCFYRPDAPPAAQPTASKHWRQTICGNHCSKCPSPLIIRKPVYQIYTTVCSASDVSWQRGTARICCSKQSISPAHRAHNSRVGRTNGTDRRSPYHCIDLALRTKHAVPIWYEIRTAVVFNNQLQVVMH